jgi:hypothetical protein
VSDHSLSPARCPSAQPGMQDLLILGVVSGSAEKPRVAYLRESVPVTPQILAMSEPVTPTEVFRLAGHCAEEKCVHFNGTKCALAARIVEMLPEVTESLPPCIIRPTCRWYRQEGRSACLRCPQIVTFDVVADDQRKRVADASLLEKQSTLGGTR